MCCNHIAGEVTLSSDTFNSRDVDRGRLSARDGARRKIAQTFLIGSALILIIQIASPSLGQSGPLDRVAPYRWSDITGATTSERNRSGALPDGNGAAQGKEPLFDQIVRPSKLRFEEDGAAGKSDTTQPETRTTRLGRQPKFE